MAEIADPQVRTAEAADLPWLLELFQQLSENSAHSEADVRSVTAEHQAALDELLRNPDFHLLVLEEHGDILGTCVLYIVPNLTHGAARWGIVENVVVDERARSRGYGERLMDGATRLAREAGCYRLSLMSNQRRGDAHRFYERLGFDPSHVGFSKYFI